MTDKPSFLSTLKFIAPWILGAMFGMAIPAFAANLPAACGSAPFSACSLSGSTCTCTGNVSITQNIGVTSATALIFSGTSTLNLKQGKTLGSSGVALNVTMGTGSAIFDQNSTSYLNISSNSATIKFNENSKLYGNATSTNGTVTIDNNSTVNGNVTAASITGGGRVTGTCSIDSSPSPTCGSIGAPPVVATNPVTAITSSTATLNGSVNPNGYAVTSITFSYGTASGVYTTTLTANPSSLASSSSASTVSAFPTGLTCNKTYYVKATATNSAGTTGGNEVSFTTAACPILADKLSTYESSLSNANAATQSMRILGTRVASTTGNLCKADGTTCTIRIAGIYSNAVSTSLNQSISGTLQYCQNPIWSGAGPSSTVSCGGTWLDIPGVATQTANLVSGVVDLTFGHVPNSYEIARVNITSSAIPGGPWQSEDYFAIRPSSFVVSGSDATDSTPGALRSLNVGTYTHKTMEPFTLVARAMAGTGTASNYTGNAGGAYIKSISTASPSGTGVINGTLSTGTWSASGGSLTDNAATYSEVGTIAITLEDRSFTAIDKNDTPTSERYFSGTANIGRFTPHHFAVTATPACGTFTYGGSYTPSIAGQPFTVKVTAYTKNSTPTLNYKFTTNTVTLTDANGLSVGSIGASANTISSSSFSSTDGSATSPTVTYNFNKKNSEEATISIRATDTDSISSNGYEGSASSSIRSGRLTMKNAYGPEVLNLPVQIDVEQYTSSGWQKGATDTCTSISPENFTITFPADAKNKMSHCSTAVLSTSGAMSSSKIANMSKSGLFGWAVITPNLTTAGIGNKCTAVGGSSTGLATTMNTPWLAHDWLGTSTASNPSAFVVFGVASKAPMIYKRESY